MTMNDDAANQTTHLWNIKFKQKYFSHEQHKLQLLLSPAWNIFTWSKIDKTAGYNGLSTIFTNNKKYITIIETIRIIFLSPSLKFHIRTDCNDQPVSKSYILFTPHSWWKSGQKTTTITTNYRISAIKQQNI